MGPERRLLYVSPVAPALTGNGLAMRAGMVLQALAERYRVSLLIAPLYVSPDREVPRAIADCCQQIVHLPFRPRAPERPGARGNPLLRWLGRARRTGSFPPEPALAAAGLVDARFEVVHVFRLAALPFARPWLEASEPRPRRHLDLDDVESPSHASLAALYRLNGEEEMASFEDSDAERSAALEAEVLRDFERVYVCSEADRAALRGRARAELCVLPNALAVPDPLPPPPRDGPFTFLFVGTLGYYPNEDAIVHFCRTVLPLIRRAAQREFRVAIVGTGATPAIRRLAGLPEVHLVGAVPEVAPWYRDASAAIVPIRAGGGTRIKVLEAFSYRRPVVSTRVGIEGIEARDGEYVLLADTPDGFAAQCLRLMDDASLGDRLAANAFSLFLRAYTTEAVAKRLTVPA